MKEDEVKAVCMDDDFSLMQSYQMTTRSSHRKHRILRSTELFRVDLEKANLFPKLS